MEPTSLQLAVLVLCSILIGFSKTGMPTLGLFVAAVMASVYPARESVGLITPVLIIGDIIAILYYRKEVVWRHLATLLPWVFAGLIGGFLVLGRIHDRPLSILLGSLVLALLLLHLFKNRIESAASVSLSSAPAFNNSLGVLAGFTTMIGNAAGSIMSIYLLAKGMDKMRFVGTNAMFFFIVNVAKVPFTASLGLITADTLVLNAWMIPAVAAGAWVGIKLLPLIPQKVFQALILGLAALGGLNLILF
ncbi:sulfite exporter TauE/SafE family protein [Paenibacillus sp. FSL W8-1187]|uniref:sulfite exporter TauE/SafE family protein n=1 Tax=unclassified Paenibacillus TaxID=185978 RepID=UPI00129AA7EA|nr:sulfite exporter TauE/SafE family protein [Paenibacillus sp. B01]QGG56851.1 TSUP family transporter [Paenibacillus sp. B01]